MIVDASGEGLEEAVATTAEALQRGEIVVIPTDTVYGVAADAFVPTATERIFAAKMRSRVHPLPVLVADRAQISALVVIDEAVLDRLAQRYWPGPLTVIGHEQGSLAWDLGDNEGTVAVRIPDDPVALAVIRAVGPLAVTSANRSGDPPATTAAAAEQALGEIVAVYVDGGPREERSPSAILDLTRDEAMLLRDGDLDRDEVLAVARGEEPS